jgi:hypothetical protein
VPDFLPVLGSHVPKSEGAQSIISLIGLEKLEIFCDLEKISYKRRCLTQVGMVLAKPRFLYDQMSSLSKYWRWVRPNKSSLVGSAHVATTSQSNAILGVFVNSALLAGWLLDYACCVSSDTSSRVVFVAEFRKILQLNARPSCMLSMSNTGNSQCIKSY